MTRFGVGAPGIQLRAEKPPAHPLERLGSDADGEFDAAIFASLARHDFGVLVEPVQPLPVRAGRDGCRQAAAAREPALRSPRCSASMPSPVSAEIAIGPSRASEASNPSRCLSSSWSTLFQTSMSFSSAPSTPSSPRIASTSSACASVSAWAMSRTCRITSAAQHLFQRRAERRDQHGRQIGDEADGVGKDRRAAVRQLMPPHGRVERREQHVLRHHVGAGQPVEQRRFAGVGVADERDDRDTGTSLAARRGAARASA